MEMPRECCFHEIGLNEPKLLSLAQRPVAAEHGEVAGATFDLKLRPNRRKVFAAVALPRSAFPRSTALA
jgi:hypothetical protein